MTTEAPPITGLIAKLADVMASVTRLAKTMEQPSQHYRFTPITEMLDWLRPELAKRKVVIVPDVEACEFETTTTTRGTAMVVCHMTVRWTVYDGDTGASLGFRTIGEAADSSDKAANKAMTAAQKQAVSKLVMMTTGEVEDTEAEPDVERVAPVGARRAPDGDKGHGICPDHGVPYFQSGKMRSPAHKLDSGSWCNKPDLGAGEALDGRAAAEAMAIPPTLVQHAAAIAAARQAAASTPMPQSVAMAPHGVCPEHKAVLVPIGQKIGHWRTVSGKREPCFITPAPSLDQQADGGWRDLGPGGTMKPKGAVKDDSVPA